MYDRLVNDELTNFLQVRHAEFDILSADTLVHFGPLEEVVAAAGGALRPGGQFVFTLEELGAAADSDFRIETHGLYGHSQIYVERVLRGAVLPRTLGRRSEDRIRASGGRPVARATRGNGQDDGSHV